MSRRKKMYVATAQAVCTTRKKWTSSIGLTSISDIMATTKHGAELAAKREWKRRGELPAMRGARCKIHVSVEEV